MKAIANFHGLSLAGRCLYAVAVAAILCLLAQLVSAGATHRLLIWPISAVGFSLAWHFGIRWLPVAAFGGALWAFATTRDLQYAAVLACGSILGPWIAIHILRHLAEWKPPEYRLDFVTRYLAVSLLISAPINALVFAALITTAQIDGFPPDRFTHLMLAGWLADALGMMLVSPALLALIRPPHAEQDEATTATPSPRISLPTVLVVSLIAALSYALNRLGFEAYASLVLFGVFIPMIWLAASQNSGRADAYTLLIAAMPLLACRAYATSHRSIDQVFIDTLNISLLLCCAVLAAQLLQALAADRSNALQRMSQQARQDMSTGLLNDRGLLAELSDRLAAPQRPSYGLIGLYISNYDAIHDLSGTVEAMQLEQATANLLIQQTSTHLAARLSAGRYTLLVHAETVAQVRAVAREIYAHLSGQVFLTEHGTIRLQCHIGGLLLDPNSQITSEDCLTALSDAQAIAASIRDPQLFIEPLSQTVIDARRAHQKKIEHIREAIRNDRIDLYAQPLIDPEAPALMRSYEILTRLRDKDGQMIRPPEFLSLASQAQMSVLLDRAVIRRTFEWLASNPEALALTWKCSINLAGATMSDDSIAAFIREQRANHAIPAAKVVFEITESEAIRNPAAASRLVDDLKDQGFGIALDDFGTGLATFEYLKRFPLDYLKIDGSFVRNLMSNPIDEEIILSTVRVAKRLKLRTVAEHVHNAAIYERLTDLGIAYLQGDFFGKAMPLAELFERQPPSTALLRHSRQQTMAGTSALASSHAAPDAAAGGMAFDGPADSSPPRISPSTAETSAADEPEATRQPCTPAASPPVTASLPALPGLPGNETRH
ncbi:MAG: EAL domain-containing protein [Lautropia sp.]|nr:EAL domain-containing protein [Lautropia sp.]